MPSTLPIFFGLGITLKPLHEIRNWHTTCSVRYVCILAPTLAGARRPSGRNSSQLRRAAM